MDSDRKAHLAPQTTLSATVFRADGRVEELGIIARTHGTAEDVAQDLHESGVGHIKNEEVG